MLDKADIEHYFIAEKNESLIFLIIGLAVVVTGIVFYFGLKTPVLRGAAVPLLLLGLLQSIAGYAVYQRSDDQRINNVYNYGMQPGRLKTEEMARMEKVNHNFVLLRWIEVAAVLGGLAMILFFRGRTEHQFWFGLGIALSLMAGELFMGDMIAEKRARVYYDLLKTFNGVSKPMHP